MANLTILHSEPSKITDGKVLLVSARKSTSKNPVPETEKYRAVEISPYAELQKFEVLAAENQEIVHGLFVAAVNDAVMNAAVEVLKEYTIANKEAKEIAEEMLSFSSVMAKMESLQTSQRLSGEQISAWYDASKSKEDAAKRYGDSEKGKKQQAALREKYISLASNNPGIDATLATKMLGYINPEDVASPVAAAIAKRLERLSKVDTADDL